jgi:FkbM family methyltransferase
MSEYFSQFGEDKFILESLSHIPIRTFCEVGAYDGVESSNTLAFEKLGARGVCIDADAEMAARCVKNRISPTLCCAIGKERCAALFYVNPGARGNSGLAQPGIPENVAVYTLYEALRLVGLHTSLDLLSIDTEGTELDVIAGMGPIRPAIIIAEFWTQPNPPVPDAIKQGVEVLGYREAWRSEANLIFIRV